MIYEQNTKKLGAKRVGNKLKNKFSMLVLMIFFASLVITAVYAENATVDVSVWSGGWSITPMTAVVGNGGTVTWNSETTIFVPPATHIQVIVPGGGPFAGGFDSGKVPIGTPIVSPPANWPEDVNSQKYTIKIYNVNGEVIREHDPWLSPPPVGGIWVPVDKFGLLAPYIGLASTMLVATVATAVYVKRVKHRKEKQ